MRRALLLASASWLCVALAQPVYAVVATLPTAGLAATSVAVGVVGALGGITGANGGGWLNRIFLGVGGAGLTVLDPPAAAFYGGSITIDYPSNLLAFDHIGWFGNFASDPSAAPPPPVTAEEQAGFYDSNGVVYNLQEGPSGTMQVSVSNHSGVLTISFSSPTGIAAPPAQDFNFMGITFTNVSGHVLDWALDQGGGANFFLDNAASSLTCKPEPSFLQPVGCSANAPIIGYQISVPEPSTWALMLFGFAGVWFARSLAARRRVTPSDPDERLDGRVGAEGFR